MGKKKSRSAKKKVREQSHHIPWDATFKAFFSHRIMVESLLTSFLAQQILAGLDWSTLEPWNSSHVTRALKQRFNDCIWRVKTDKGLLYFYFMLEFQRTPDKLMAFRIAEYSSLLIRMLHKSKVITLNNDKPAIIPIVIVNDKNNLILTRQPVAHGAILSS